MRRITQWLLIALACGLAAVSCSSRLPIDRILAAYQDTGAFAPINLRYPEAGAIFPPQIPPPTFLWQDSKSDVWLVVVELGGQDGRRVYQASAGAWTPKPAEWADIQQRSRQTPARVTLIGVRRADPLKILSHGKTTLSTSKDEVGASLFYREVNLPFIAAVKDSTRIRWRFGSIASPQPPPVVLEHLPVCGNCHSFSQDGRVLGMDVDYANNKGSYAITRVAKRMTLASSDIMSWGDYRKEDRQPTFGLLSQVSPNGQMVVSTVKDKSVFVEKPDLAFSQLFFPIQGILVVYRRSSGTFEPLPGADDPEYVQSNPCWSPDGKYIVFARSKAYHLRNPAAQNKLLLNSEDCAEFLKDGLPFRFDLYRVPFNEGRGGKAEPLEGASRNGRSNFFARFSPDGKWIIFCQAKSYMLLQPDSELFIIPSAGGEPRRLRGNTSRMNSWHSWSPNSRWLVFSSKANSPFTQLFLTHIDEQGESSPSIVLTHMTAPDRAANIPEFVNAPPDAIEKIQEQFLNDYSYARTAYVAEMSGDVDRAIAGYEQALALNPKNAHAHQRLGALLYRGKNGREAGLVHTAEALRLEPNDACALYDLGAGLLDQQQFDRALVPLMKAVQLMPEGFDAYYNPGVMRYAIGTAWIGKGDLKEAAAWLAKAAAVGPKNAQIHYTLAMVLVSQGLIDEPVQHFALAKSLQPELDTLPQFHESLSANYARAGQYRLAIESAERALSLARGSGNAALTQEIQQLIEAYRQQLSGQ